jgi:predicted RNase H-like HicB family nuclease
MKGFAYRIVVEWSAEDNAFVARVPALPACAAHGKSEAQAARSVREAAEGMIAVLNEDGDALPPSDLQAEHSGQLRLRLPKSLHGRLAQAASIEGVSLNQLLVTMLAEQVGAATTRVVAGESKRTVRVKSKRSRAA